MLASMPDYSIQVIENLQVMGTGTLLSFITAQAGDGKRQDQTRPWRTVDR